MRSKSAIVGLIFVACSGFASLNPVSAGAGKSTIISMSANDSAASSYPDWAAAVVPVYPNALPSSGLITPKLYGISTTDALPKVVEWYKSRVHGEWTETEGGDTWSIKTGGLRIQISKNFYDDSGNEKPGTRIALTKAS